MSLCACGEIIDWGTLSSSGEESSCILSLFACVKTLN